MEKTRENYYDQGINDFVNKIPDINNYDFWVRFGQTLLQVSDEKETTKSISHIVANAIVKALDERKSKL